MDCCIILLTIILIVIIAAVLNFRFASDSKFDKYFEKQEIPGPKPLFLTGTWGKRMHTFFGDEDVEKIKEYGKLVATYDGKVPHLLVIDPEIIKEILLSTDHFLDFRATTVKNEILKRSLVILSGGENRKTEALINSLLQQNKIAKLMPRLEAAADALTTKIVDVTKRDVAPNDRWLLLSVDELIRDLIAFSIYGIDLNSDPEFEAEFSKSTAQILTVSNPTSYSRYLEFVYYGHFGDEWILPKRSLRYLIQLTASGIKETPRNQTLFEGKACNLIDILVNASEEEKRLTEKKEDEDDRLVLKDDEIICQCIAAILSLSSFAKKAVVFTVYELAKNQNIQDELFAEIQKREFEKISIDDLQTLNYLDAVLKEVFRLHPSEFRLEKISKDDHVIGPVKFENGVKVSIPIYALHRHEEFYPEPEIFKPERFFEKNSENRKKYTYLPFGQSGFNSSNVGIQISLLAIKIAVYKLIQKFKFKKGTDQEEELYVKGLTGVPQPNGIQIIAELRK